YERKTKVNRKSDIAAQHNRSGSVGPGCLDQLDLVKLTNMADRLGFTAIRDQHIDLVEMRDPDRGGSIEFRGIGNQNHISRILSDRMGDVYLAIVVAEQGAIPIDGRGADARELDLELPDEGDRRCADDAAVGAPDDAAGDHHLDLRI